MIPSLYIIDAKTQQPRDKITYERLANVFVNEVYSIDVNSEIKHKKDKQSMLEMLNI